MLMRRKESMSQIFVQGYTILRILGEGGFGRVYLARHDQTGEQVALKVILPEIIDRDRDSIKQFLREMANTKALNHPNIVHMRDCGYYDNIFFLTLEYCNGGSLEDLIRQRGKLPIDEALPIILQVLDGLEYAHKAEISHVKLADGNFGRAEGLVHRDLNPRNIFFAKTNGICIAKIGDFGLAKAFDLAGLSGLTQTDESAGTPHFMPRQQVLNFKYAKPEVDIWATAACLYYMLTGKFPRDFISEDPWEEVLNTQAVPIRERDPSIPDKLAELIDLALVDNPKIHFKNATDFKHELLKTLPLV